MGFPSEVRDIFASRRSNNSPLIASPAEDLKAKAANDCVQGVRAGLKAAAVMCVVTAVPTVWLFSVIFSFTSCYQLVAVRKIPWAKANLNYTGQALIISAVSIASYFITVDKTILECARRNAQFHTVSRRGHTQLVIAGASLDPLLKPTQANLRHFLHR
ncbi:Early nodulin-like protein [Citrus sinensis]|uniref:Early nodulin-like protein n=1 Tax=Citrus sinensis TaxID=2711 RepID=A0ACB8NQK2_CITSI|nr:Early nodulin-like protein [Citrus sinensis]KAH9799790.1 Early nodulin-like protein [Citrus sinensis]